MSPDTPRVSVVIPTYNRASRLMGALASVRAQTLRDHEVIVVDDGSTDDTAARFEAEFGDDARFRLVAQANAGAAAARNRGIALARAPWTALLDSDDRMRPERLAGQLEEALSVPDADAVVSDLALVGPWQLDGPTIFTSGGYRAPTDLRAMCLGAWGPTSATLVRTDLIREHRYDERMRAVEDSEWWFRLLKTPRKIVIHPVVVGEYVRHTEGEGAPQLSEDEPLHRLARYRLLARYGDACPGTYKGEYQWHRGAARYLLAQDRAGEARYHAFRWWLHDLTSTQAWRALFRSLFTKKRPPPPDDPLVWLRAI